MNARKTRQDETKANGVHYTPADLAAFLAEVTLAASRDVHGPVRVLDPACGDGGLLKAIAAAVPDSVRSRMIFEGFDTSPEAIVIAESNLTGLGRVILHRQDFLAEENLFPGTQSVSLNAEPTGVKYDLIIANPPYVRTQILGANRAKALARRFGLTGRVDLYQAFARAMVGVLKPGGVLGMLTSNRFLTIKSGASLRDLFTTDFDLEAIYDLGDTKLFLAAVLPVILVGRKGHHANHPCAFHRVYATRHGMIHSQVRRDSILQALRDELMGVVETPAGSFCIERGTLRVDPHDHSWSLATKESCDWLNTIRRHQSRTFGELGKIRVGLKTTADKVFIRTAWESLPDQLRPERALIHPLLTHHVAQRWQADPPQKFVLYPHEALEGKRYPIDLARYPKAAAYLEAHRDRLSARPYVRDSGRHWYEIWVPHNPDDWNKPKIAYPDISEHPRFCFDDTGMMVNGDCYWITLNEGVDPDWLLLMLAVANSTFITKFYDVMFHNKLYAGRRRFMTQYVEKFPLPDLARCPAIVQAVKQLLENGLSTWAEQQLNRQVWESFGLREE